jgi:hypothetical protein
MIISITPTDPLAFLAARLGFMIGTNSGARCLVENPERYTWAFPVSFIDNEFKKYDHLAHLEAVRMHCPKYATVRDLMTPEQCERAGIEYYDFDAIMFWAEEIEQYAENVIVIPKWDCLDQIPERFILGYSIPTRYAGTPLPFEIFQNRRVHLLGGSWKRQRKLILQYRDCIVSLDNNNLWKKSVYGSFDYPDGKQSTLEQIGITQLSSPMFASVPLSLGHIANELHRIYSEPKPRIEPIAVQFPQMREVV